LIVKPGSIFYDGDGKEYEVLDFLGDGSFGDVYRMKSLADKSFYALKTIQSPFVSDKILKSFINEGELAQNVSHENVIKYYYFHDGNTYPSLRLYIIMEYANQGTLQAKIDNQIKTKDFSPNDILIELFLQLCNGMTAINEKLIHRDIKPDNILFNNNVVKISDFGLSKIVTESTRTSTFKGIGCLPFLAPEGWNNDKNTIKMDIYSMGFVFYELSCLKHPLKINKGDYKEWQDAHLYQIPEPPDKINTELSPSITRTIMKMISKKASDRFNDWIEIGEALKKEYLPKTDNTSFIDSIIQRKNELKQKALEIKAAKEKRENEIISFNNTVSYQLETEIIKPLHDFLEEFNIHSDSGKYHIKKGSHTFHYLISSNFGQIIKIELTTILEEDFWRDIEVREFGDRFTRRKLLLPHYNNKPIMAWGHIKANAGYGMNLLLVKNNIEDLYGEWILLINRNSAFNTKPRIEPFAFEFNELEKAIPSLKAIGFYSTDIYGLDLNKIKEFISNFL